MLKTWKGIREIINIDNKGTLKINCLSSRVREFQEFERNFSTLKLNLVIVLANVLETYLTLFFPMFSFDPPENGGSKGNIGKKRVNLTPATYDEICLQITFFKNGKSNITYHKHIICNTNFSRVS